MKIQINLEVEPKEIADIISECDKKLSSYKTDMTKVYENIGALSRRIGNVECKLMETGD